MTNTTNTPDAIKVVLSANLHNYLAQIVDAMDLGWRVDFEKNIPTTYGFMYEAHMLRDASVVDPVSRADILATARAAKAAKRVAGEAQ